MNRAHIVSSSNINPRISVPESTIQYHINMGASTRLDAIKNAQNFYQKKWLFYR
jgi:hypothetical protein